MSSSTSKEQTAAVAARPQGTKLLMFAIIVLSAFLLSYSYAVARSTDTTSTATADSGGFFSPAAGGGGGGGCCGGGPSVEGATTVEGDAQRIAVDTSAGSFNPNVIKAKAGVPIVMEFSQAPGGCMTGVYFPDFGIDEDLTGGPKTIELPALDAGEYTFYCQMQMISATIVVE